MVSSYELYQQKIRNTDRVMRFWVPDPKTGCWLWSGGVSRTGYGRARNAVRGKVERAHRLSWNVFVGAIPKGSHVLHRCDVPRCVNPSHLFLGDQESNNLDRDQKCRSGKMLTSRQVSDIRCRLRGGASRKSLSNEYRVSYGTIGKIARKETWLWV